MDTFNVMKCQPNLHLLKFQEDCFPDASERQPGWYRKACTDPIWKDLRQNCSTYIWNWVYKPDTQKINTTACNGIWGSEHVRRVDKICNTVYDCTDRSDEADCEKTHPQQIIFGIKNCIIR